MGFFNKKELAEIERLKKELVKEKAVNKEIEDLLRTSRLDNLNLTRDVNKLQQEESIDSAKIKELEEQLLNYKGLYKNLKAYESKTSSICRNLNKSNKELVEENVNLKKVILEKEEDLEDLGDVLIAEQSELKRLKKDVTTLGNTLKSATNELNDSTELIIKYKQALKEIAEYDFDRHKKAYLLNDFFQQRAKKALAEDE
jgi:chromosome segregation ATPase